MRNKNPLDYSLNRPISSGSSRIRYILKDIPLYFGLVSILSFGLMMLYSSSGQSSSMVIRQTGYVLFGLALMSFVSHLKPDSYKNILMHSYWLGILLLIYVLFNPADGYSTCLLYTSPSPRD